MARSSGRSQWERQQIALRREMERQAREQARLAKEQEKARQQQHFEAQQRTAEVRTATVEHQADALEKILTGALSSPVQTFDALRVVPKPPRFDPGPLSVAEPSGDSRIPVHQGARCD